MRNIIKYFTYAYYDEKLYKRKKAEYSVTFICLILLVMLVILSTELIVEGFSAYKVIQTILFMFIFITLLFLIRAKKLELAINILIISGIFRCGILYFYTDAFQFYTTSLLIVLSAGVVHVRRYQLYIIFTVFPIVFLVKIKLYIIKATQGFANTHTVLQSFYTTCILVVFIFMVHCLVQIINREIQASEDLEWLANTDALTGLYNRRKLEDMLETSMRTNRTFSVILFDIDHFKHINDKYGHKTGDKILKTIVHTVKRNISEDDIFFRWGGDEFIILANHARLNQAFRLAEKVRTSILAENVGLKNPVTISLGIAEYHEDETSEHLIAQADEALYCAKENGRNRTEVLHDIDQLDFLMK